MLSVLCFWKYNTTNYVVFCRLHLVQERTDTYMERGWYLYGARYRESSQNIIVIFSLQDCHWISFHFIFSIYRNREFNVPFKVQLLFRRNNNFPILHFPIHYVYNQFIASNVWPSIRNRKHFTRVFITFWKNSILSSTFRKDRTKRHLCQEHSDLHNGRALHKKKKYWLNEV